MHLEKLNIDGRFFCHKGERFLPNGVTLGPYPPGSSILHEVPKIASAGFNMVRVYTPPSERFLDACHAHGLTVFASVPWSWGTDFLENRSALEEGFLKTRAFLDNHAHHPALAGIYIANEIPAELVRWMGAHLVKEALEDLITRLRAAHPAVLYAYANYPTTEYLELSNADFTAFNLYLEDEPALTQYLQSLQIIAGERPLIISEFGVDAIHHGTQGQAKTLALFNELTTQLGNIGTTVFSWSDLWWNRDQIVEGWNFGLTCANGEARASSLTALEKRPLGADPSTKISVIICSYNGEHRIKPCLEALLNLRAENYEVIIIDDGSQDHTTPVAHSYRERFQNAKIPYLVHTQPNQGLSAARNAGATLSSGHILAYTDDDARPDQDWLTWLRVSFANGTHIGMVGGYGLQPVRSSTEANEVSKLPGQACPVLIDNTNAEHLPGCNMAVRKNVWKQVGGFNERYRVAGDDVDFCWRVIDADFQVKMQPSAYVWHECRATYRAYLKQQWGYGKAEALLYQDHRLRFHKNNILWKGAVYMGAPRTLTSGSTIYTGWSGTAPFQPIIYGTSSFKNSNTIKGRLLRAFHPTIRALARLYHGMPFRWQDLISLPAQAPPPINTCNEHKKKYWDPSYTSRNVLIDLFKSDGWTCLEDLRWDLRKDEALLRFAFEQPSKEGQILHIAGNDLAKPASILEKMGFTEL